MVSNEREIGCFLLKYLFIIFVFHFIYRILVLKTKVNEINNEPFF